LIGRRTQKIGFVDGSEGPCFNLFTQLPSEIRLAIWRLALPLPRLISIFSDEDDEDTIHYSTPWFQPKMTKAKNTPSAKLARRKFYGIFHACKESREEALLFYRVLVPNPEAVITFKLPKWAIPPYVNTFHDIFVIPEPREGPDSLPTDLAELLITYGEQLELLKTIATSEMIVRARDKGEKAYDKLNRLFPGATRLVLLYPPGSPVDSRRVYAPPCEGHGEAVNREYLTMRAAHSEWSIRSVEVTRYDGGILPTVPLPVGKEIDLDVTYMRKLAIRRRRGMYIS
jgi:hypothetical protein